MEEEGQQLHIRSALGSLIVATICALDSVALASAAVSTTRPMVATWLQHWLLKEAAAGEESILKDLVSQIVSIF